MEIEVFERFEWMNAWVDDRGLSTGAKVVLMVLFRHMNESGEAWPSRKAIAEKAGYSKAQKIDRYLSEVCEAGYLEKSTRKNATSTYRALVPQTGTPQTGTSTPNGYQVVPQTGTGVVPQTGTRTDHRTEHLTEVGRREEIAKTHKTHPPTQKLKDGLQLIDEPRLEMPDENTDPSKAVEMLCAQVGINAGTASMQIATACIYAGITAADIPKYITERLVSLTTRTPKFRDQQILRYLASARDVEDWKSRQPQSKKSSTNNLMGRIRGEMRERDREKAEWERRRANNA